MRDVIVAGIASALLFARAKPQGVALVETTPEGAWRSFAAALICLPALLAIRFLAWASFGAPEGGVLRGLMLALTVPAALGLPPSVVQVLTLLGISYALWLEWFVTRHALGVDGGKAAAVVGLDLALGLFLAGLIRNLSGG
jgi:hypothetical protein